MIEANDTLYPIHTIKEIRIDKESLTLTIYFNDSKNYPVVITFNSDEKLEEKIREIKGENNGKRKPLFG